MIAWRVAAWTLVITGTVAVGWVANARLSAAEPASVARRADVSQPNRPDRLADTGASRIVARDLFRAQRRPAVVVFDPVRASQSATVTPPRPTLSLVGVVAGRDPTALVEGLPGVEGVRVMRQGDVVGGLTVRSIGNDSVGIVGMDTVWVLGVRKPWR